MKTKTPKTKLISLFTLLSFFVLLPTASAMSANYNVIVGEGGNSLVVLNIDGEGTLNVPLPLDVISPTVDGAMFVQAENGIDVFVGSTSKATLTYDSALFTSKTADWTFEMELPNAAAQVELSLPKNANIASTSPQATIEQKETHQKLTWNVDASTARVQANYVIEGAAPKAAGEGFPFLYIIIVIVVILLAINAYVYMKKKGPKQKTESGPSKEKKNVLRALTENETKIVNLLLDNKGEMRRNKLERSSGLAKSSLASTLNNLERRKIIQIDKSSVVHTVELTEWFKSL